MATDLTNEELDLIEKCVYGGCDDRIPEDDCRRLVAEVRRNRILFRELKTALDWMVAESGCSENGEYDTEAARSAEALLDRLDAM